MAGKRGNNEGSVYKTKDGRWAGALTLAGAKRKVFYGKTRAEASAKLVSAIRDRDRGLPSVNEQKTLGQYLPEWLAVVKPTVRPGTWIRYEQYVRVHLVSGLGRKAIARLTPEDLETLYTQKVGQGLSPTTVHHMHTVLHAALDLAMERGQVARNVAALAKPPKVARSDMETLNPEQARAFLAAAQGDRLEALYVTALSTGAREGELLALSWDSVDLDRGTIQIRANVRRVKGQFVFGEPKTPRSRRQVSLTPTAIDALRRHHAQQAEERLKLGSAWFDMNLVFANEVGRPIEPPNLLRRSFYPLLKRAKTPDGKPLPSIHFHSLRHTAATLLLARGTHPKLVADMLGHSQVSVTLDRYSHVTVGMHQAAAATMEAVLQG